MASGAVDLAGRIRYCKLPEKPKRNEVKEGIDCWRAETAGIACELPKARDKEI